MCEMFDIDVPIFAFTHCRDVVVEVSKAGGFGVLGMARMHPDRVEQELSWIDERIDGKPYGIDVLMPSSYENSSGMKFDPDELFPDEHIEFVRNLLDEAGIPRLPKNEEEEIKREIVDGVNFTPEESLAMVETAIRHPIRAIVNALGTPPAQLIKAAVQQGIKVGALAGKPRHALRHKEAGCDFVVAVGTEAGGHTGDISSLVLWPSIINTITPLPILNTNKINNKKQITTTLILNYKKI